MRSMRSGKGRVRDEEGQQGGRSGAEIEGERHREDRSVVVGSGSARRKPKVSFEGVNVREEQDGEEAGTRPGSRNSGDDGRAAEGARDDVQEICRRMWGMIEGGVED